MKYTIQISLPLKSNHRPSYHIACLKPRHLFDLDPTRRVLQYNDIILRTVILRLAAAQNPIQLFQDAGFLDHFLVKRARDHSFGVVLYIKDIFNVAQRMLLRLPFLPGCLQNLFAQDAKAEEVVGSILYYLAEVLHLFFEEELFV